MQHSKSHQAHAKARGPRRRIFTGAVTVVGSAGLAAAVLLPSGTALASYQATSPTGTTIANVDVGSAISLTISTASFALTGVVGNTPVNPSAVTMTVVSNNTTGYNVSVQPALGATDLVGTGTNTDVIPVTDLSVRETPYAGLGTDPNTITTGYTPLTPATPLVVYNQVTRSAPSTTAPVFAGGDVLTNDYEFNTPIPDVSSDTYSVTLDYIATTNT